MTLSVQYPCTYACLDLLKQVCNLCNPVRNRRDKATDSRVCKFCKPFKPVLEETLVVIQWFVIIVSLVACF